MGDAWQRDGLAGGAVVARHQAARPLIDEHAELPLHDGWMYCPCPLAKGIRAILMEGERRGG